jgi:hypothetical protein
MQSLFKTAIGTDYENPLFTCQKALKNWRDRREKVVNRPAPTCAGRRTKNAAISTAALEKKPFA